VLDFKPRAALGKLPAEHLHTLLQTVAKLAPKQLERPSVPHLKALLKAYVSDKKEIRCVMSGKADDVKPDMAVELIRLIGENPDGFVRYDASAFAAVG
jgi:hypothetical protein